jgi:hypothetical protein
MPNERHKDSFVSNTLTGIVSSSCSSTLSSLSRKFPVEFLALLATIGLKVFARDSFRHISCERSMNESKDI